MKRRILIRNIKNLLQVSRQNPSIRKGKDMQELPSLDNAWLFCENDKIKDYGLMTELPSEYLSSETVLDATGRIVMPSFCDSHTHLVYAGSRESELIDKIRGLSYEDIAKKGGGILNSAKRLHSISEDELFEQSASRVREIMNHGTCAVEIKSGYGLNTPDELKMLRVIRRIKEEFPITVKSTFLGAHALPEEFKGHSEKYVDIVINEMIPAVASEKLADFIDVFCDRGFFTPKETAKILSAGFKYGLRPKIHANELAFSGGIQTGVEHHALSVDHLEYTGDEEINLLLNSTTMPTILPGASFFLGIGYAPARKMIDSGLPLALASDYNPGSSPSGNMSFILSLACIKLRMLPEEAINAVTLNSAYAMGIDSLSGSITPGKYSSFIITSKIPGPEFIPYSFGSDLVEHVYCKGIKIK
jgi:imidazolonepropionase